MTDIMKSKTRIELDKAHLEIIKRREYRGARESYVVQWLAEYVENNYVDKIDKLLEANRVMRARLESIVEIEKFLKDTPSMLQSDCEKTLAKSEEIMKGIE